MKKQELYKIMLDGEILHENLSRDDMFDILDDLSEKFYSKGAPHPEDIVVEYQGNLQE